MTVDSNTLKSPAARPHAPWAPGPDRVVAVDVLRGLVVMLLIPDVTGGFSFHRMAERDPENPAWATLAAAFSHVPWAGVALWDMVMPCFVFLVGVAMALSRERRLALGEARGELLAHAVLRSASLMALGMLVVLPVRTLFDDLAPFVLLAAAMPWSRWWKAALGAPSRPTYLALEYGIQAIAVCMAWVWIVLHLGRAGPYDLNQILVQLGLAYLPAHLMMGRDLRTPAWWAAAVLTAWTAAFLAYPAPEALIALADYPAAAHWGPGTNLAARFDLWFLNLLPRESPYLGNAHGYQTLQFVPLISVMLVGVIVGRLFLRDVVTRRLVTRLVTASTAGLLISAVLAVTVAPLVKSLWTPSWTIFSTAIVVLALALLHAYFRAGLGLFLVYGLQVLGTNAILLYVLALHDRWRVLGVWHRLLGADLIGVAWQPVLESLLVLSSLWLLAFVLYRARIFFRI